MKLVFSTFIIGICFIIVFITQFAQSENSQKIALDEAHKKIQTYNNEKTPYDFKSFYAKKYEAFGTLKIPKLNKTLPIIEGVDETALEKGIGHLPQTLFPGQKEQIVFSGHRDQVFRGFSKIKIGDLLIVHMPYGTFKYKIRKIKIVNKNDTTIIRKTGQESLVLSTCYPFNYVGSAPKRFIVYAYPVK